MSKRTMIFLLLAVVLLHLTGCTQKQVAEAPELLEPAGYTMDTAVVDRGRISWKRFFIGQVMPGTKEAAFTTGGKLERLTVTYGDFVQEGDVLAVLDLSEAEEQIEELSWQIEYQTQINELTLRQLQLEEDSSRSALNELYANGVSWSGRRMQSLDLEEKELKLKQTEEDQALYMENLNTRLATLKKKLEYKELKAPCSGQIVYVDPAAQEGKAIADYETLFCITEDAVLYAITDQISDSLLERAESFACWINGKEYTLESEPYSKEEILAMVLSSDKKTKSRFRITNMDADVKAGDTVVICIETGIREDVLRIPSNALYVDESGYYVYIVEEGRRIRRNVYVGLKTDIMVEVTEGLEEGETVYVQE